MLDLPNQDIQHFNDCESSSGLYTCYYTNAGPCEYAVSSSPLLYNPSSAFALERMGMCHIV